MSTTVAQNSAVQAETPFWKKLAAESFGTFLLVFGGLGVGLLSSVQQGSIPVALAFGLALVAGILAVGHVSGGHFNPAVTIGAFVAKRFEAKNILPYIAAQLIGAALAMGVLYVITLDNSLITQDTRGELFNGLANQFGDVTKVKFGVMAALLTEAAVTATFVGVILSVTSKKAPKAVQNAAPFAIGLTLAVMIQLALPITNASLNPARSTAAALTAPSSLGQLWLFWVGPILGAIIAGLVFRLTSEDDGFDAELDGNESATSPLAVSLDSSSKEADDKIDELAKSLEETKDDLTSTSGKAEEIVEKAKKNTK